MRAVRVEGGSFGFQIGGAETDVIMLVLNERGAEKMLSSKFTLGGDASVAAGPVGRTTSADTDAAMHAEIGSEGLNKTNQSVPLNQDARRVEFASVPRCLRG